jgi:hypothetical protein
MNKNESDELEIYVGDFTVEAQGRIKRFLGIKEAEELNLDTFPLFVLPKQDR